MGGRSGVTERLFSGEDRWTVEARRAWLLAGELGERLDVEALAVCDLWDLLALTAGLRVGLARPPDERKTNGRIWLRPRLPFRRW